MSSTMGRWDCTQCCYAHAAVVAPGMSVWGWYAAVPPNRTRLYRETPITAAKVEKTPPKKPAAMSAGSAGQQRGEARALVWGRRCT